MQKGKRKVGRSVTVVGVWTNREKKSFFFFFFKIGGRKV